MLRATSQARVREICRYRKKILAPRSQKTYFVPCPISHVPVVVCQSVGIRTRGRTAAKGWKNRGSLTSIRTRGGQHLSPGMPLKVSPLFATVTGSRRRTGAPRSQRGTRLKATTDRAFLVSTGGPTPARATEKACPSLPGDRAGNSPNQSTAAQSGLSLLASTRLHRAMWPKRSYPTSR